MKNIKHQLNQMNVTELKGVGASLQNKLNKLGIESVQDILFHLPIRYEDRTHIYPMNQLKSGIKVCIEGFIENSQIQYGRRRTLSCLISENSSYLECRFFHFNASQKNAMIPGKKMRCFGEVRMTNRGWQMVHPEYQIFDEENSPLLPDTLTPIYPTTEGLHQKRWLSLISQALRFLKEHPLQEWLPESLLQERDFPDLKTVLFNLHAPSSEISLQQFEQGCHPMQLRLAFEELLAHQLSMKKLRSSMRKNQSAIFEPEHIISKQLLQQLPFQLTAAQKKVIQEISTDLRQSKPMLRLVQGDVGSGKTLVAAFAAIQAIAAGYQVTLMAPTDILSEQHVNNFQNWFQSFGIPVVWLSGKLTVKQRRPVEQAISDGSAKMIVGTHALFQKSVQFAKLGLVIIDEQHRFGVHQRMSLKEKGHLEHGVPHQLIMTATPIPRTLSMTAYADLDVSIIDELPPGRMPVQTALISDQRRNEVITRVQKACKQGRQAYWVCTLIEESEALQCQAAEVTAETLQNQLQGLNVGLIHGRLKAEQKEQMMTKFQNGDIHLLVATTVIEVGVDVPNASLMVIENPERLGLSQLHQLRGRVGRGSEASHCVLMYHTPLSKNSQERLSIMRQTNDGFKIAEKDLKLRGPGEVLGTRQTGMMQFKIADILEHQFLIPDVNRWAQQLISENYPHIDAIIKRWLGQVEKYADV